MRTLYDVLGVSQSATAKEIHKAFRKIAKVKHPDINKEENAHEVFTEIQEAYDILSNEELRKQYDDHLSQSDIKEFQFDEKFTELVRSLVKKRGGGMPFKGMDIKVPLHVTVRDILQNKLIEAHYVGEKTCITCDGSGNVLSKEKCAYCNGTGGTFKKTRTPFGSIETRVTCENCQGSGHASVINCATCEGKGLIPEDRIKYVQLKETMNFGEEIRIPFEGGEGKNGGTRGDLVFTLTKDEKDPCRVVYDYDVEEVIYASLENVLLEETITITLPDGSVQNISLTRNNTNPENRFSFPSKGMYRNLYNRGLYSVRVIVDFSNISDEMKEKLAKILIEG